MTWISDSDLSLMRADVAFMLPDVAIIQTVARVSDGAGGWAETWTAVTGGTVACRVDPLKRDAIDYTAKREALIRKWQVTLPYNAPIVPEARLLIGGVTYDVTVIHDNHSDNVSRRCEVAEVKS
jgi:hypothetical protein